ncbi:TetR/AcrR family transcriptional regulator [Clostridium thailandense]|uniref:TetR/AcrR family transcriptional regulator n=1 Tax=Clostridium thailandense TaxID=2794346 RepID=UPI003988DAAA
MIDKFERLPDEKKQRILDACIEEFALYGYDKASTNSIVKKAYISKGILFHYFGNKKTLFLYIFDYCINKLVNRYYSMKEKEPKDIFERIMWSSIVKMKAFHEEPNMIKLILLAISNMPKSLEPELTQRYNDIYEKNMPQFFQDIDTSKFRKDIDSQKAIELIMMCADGISNRYLQEYKNRPVDEVFNDAEKIMKDFNECMDILKFGIYPGE